MSDRALSIFCDGGARGNPGPAASAFVVFWGNGKLAHKESKFLGEATNNVAEYFAVIFALDWLLKTKDEFFFEKAVIYLDSELVVRQLNEAFRVKNRYLKELYIQVRDLEKRLGKEIIYKFVLREKNKLADFLVNKTLDSLA